MSIFLARRGDIQQGAKTTPTYRAVSTAGPTFATSLTLNKPTGTVDGDRIVVGIFTIGSNTPTLAGFTNVGSFSHASGNNKIFLFSKIASGEGASWSITGMSNTYNAATAVTVKDGNGTISAATSNGNASGGATTLATASITTAEDGAVVVRFAGAYDDVGGGTITATWATATERADFQSGGSGVGMTASTEDRATAGATGTRTVTIATSSKISHIGVAVY